LDQAVAPVIAVAGNNRVAACLTFPGEPPQTVVGVGGFFAGVVGFCQQVAGGIVELEKREDKRITVGITLIPTAMVLLY